MGKTIILSQRQLNEIIGEGSEYLETGALGNTKRPDNSVSAETYVTDDNGASIPGKPIAGSDKIASKITNQNNFMALQKSKNMGAITSVGSIKESKKKILEVNQAFKDHFFELDPTTAEHLREIEAKSKAPKDARGRMRIANIIKNNGVSYSDLNSIFSQMNDLDPKGSEFNEMGGKILYNFLKRCLVTITSVTDNSIENKKKLGLRIQRQGGTKESGNGKAHTPNMGNITLK